MKKNKNIKKLFKQPVQPYEQFHNQTKIDKFDEVSLENWPKEWKTIYYKSYGRFKFIPLVKSSLPTITLEQVLLDRKSMRDFKKTKAISLEKISNLLFFSSGQKKDLSSYRFYPSAGARFPLEIYIFPLKSSLEKYIYHYYVKSHGLEQMFPFDQSDLKEFFFQNFIEDASLVVVITAIFPRMTNKYGDRGYRYVMNEVGNLSQNFYLCSVAMELNCCFVGGFIEKHIENLLDIDGINESVVGVLAIG